ncbi:hypothetical protein BJV82DRAFT_290432 [Fennellomyces sp. T-0311]|nr:hypothetical protein BJV82DRAFT_290432 [Fennellomyces sp. T-0311]
MDTVHPEDSTCILPSARELLLHVEDRSPTKLSSTADDPSSADKMQIDEPYESSHSREPLPHNDQDSITKPHLPSITNAQPCSPIPRASSPSQQQPHSTLNNNHHLSDEYLRHRMSDMSVSVPSPPQRGTAPLPTTASPRAMSPAHELSGRALSPLEPSSQQQHQQQQQQQQQQQYYESYSRRGSITDPMLHGNHNNSPAPPLEFRRPSITDLNNLPLPTSSASASRRGSMATVATDYDYSSRSPSPSPFAKRGLPHESDYLAARRDSLPHPGVAQTQQAYDPFQRRHSIATAEVPPNNRLGSSAKHRAFRFPATIPEAPSHGPYSAPSSPPHSGSIPSSFDNPQPSAMASSSEAQRYSRQSSRYPPSLGNDHHYQYLQRSAHPYANGSSSGSGGGGPLLHHRRRSILMDEGAESGPVLARRASMPVVGMQGSHHPGMHRHHDAMQHEGYHSGYTSSGAAHHHGAIEEEKAVNRKAETPYSRSPELRVSHKLAERKRRKEMKELFDELRDSLPVEKNLKTSKWEILSKAVEYISLLKRRDFEMENEVSALRREVGMLKREREYVSLYFQRCDRGGQGKKA